MTVDRLRAAFTAGWINRDVNQSVDRAFDIWYQRELAKLTPPEIPMLDKETMTPMQRIAAEEAKEPYDFSGLSRPGGADYRDKYTGMGEKLARSIMGDNSGPYAEQGSYAMLTKNGEYECSASGKSCGMIHTRAGAMCQYCGRDMSREYDEAMNDWILPDEKDGD